MARLLPKAVLSWMTTLLAGVFVMTGTGHLLPNQIVGEHRVLASVATTSTEAGSLGFSTYVGGSKYDSIRDITTDAQGNVYITGGTTSPDFPVTKGTYQTTHNPGSPENSRIDPFDVFVTKLNPGGKILWSTFIGGSNYDRAYAVEVDREGYVYVAGRAGRGFPVTAGAFQTAFMGGQEARFYGPQDGFLLKLKPDGSGLVWASYFGTSDPSAIRDLDVDSKGDIYIVSTFVSGTYPNAVQRAFNNRPHGGNDGVVAKIKSDGSQVLWASYLGGTGWESGENSIRVDGSDNPYVLLRTKSKNIFVTEGSYQTAHAGDDDLYICKLNSANGDIIWGTYLGGSKGESTETHEFAVDAKGNAYIAAGTASADFPTTRGAYQRTFRGDRDAFVAKISSDGSRLLASTFIGGTANDQPEGMAVDAFGNVYFTGLTSSKDFPVTPDAWQSKRTGPLDAMAVKLSADFSQLLYATYIGGSGRQSGRAAALDFQGNFYLAGETNSTDWPTLNAFQRTYRGQGDSIVAKLELSQPKQKPN